MEIESFLMAGSVLCALHVPSHFTLSQESEIGPLIACLSQMRRWFQRGEARCWRPLSWYMIALSFNGLPDV